MIIFAAYFHALKRALIILLKRGNVVESLDKNKTRIKYISFISRREYLEYYTIQKYLQISVYVHSLAVNIDVLDKSAHLKHAISQSPAHTKIFRMHRCSQTFQMGFCSYKVYFLFQGFPEHKPQIMLYA